MPFGESSGSKTKVALKQKKLDQFWPQAINLDGHTAAGLVGGLDGRHGGHVR